MTRRSSFSTPALLARHLAIRPVGSVLLGLLVAVSVCGLALAPHAIASIANDELRNEVSSASPLRVDVNGSTMLGDQDIDEATADGVFGTMDDAIRAFPRTTPAPLGDILGEPHWIAQFRSQSVSPAEPLPGVSPEVSLVVDLEWADHVRILDGAAASVWPLPPDQTPSTGQPLDIMLSTASATRLDLVVGDVLGSALAPLRISGIFEPIDADDPYWAHASDILAPVVVRSAGNPDTVIVSAYLDPLSARGLPSELAQAELRLWYTTLSSRLEYSETGELLRQLQQIATAGQSLPNGQRLVFQSDITSVIDDVRSQVGTLTALLALIASAPIGVVFAALVLGIRTVVGRRQVSLELAIARGLGTAAARRIMAIEGAVIAIPAAALGLSFATVVTGTVPTEATLAPLMLAASVPVIFAVSLRAPSGRVARIDLQPRARSRARWIGEVAIVGLAALSYLLLSRRGITTASTVSIDPLLAATPLLLSLAVCIVVLRLYALPLLALLRRVRRARGAVGLLGLARAVREPAIGVVSVVAMLVAVSTAVCSLVLASTVSTALESNANTEVGADLRIDSVALATSTIAAVRQVSGVTAVAPLEFVQRTDLRFNSRLNVTLVIADTAALHAVRPEFPVLADGPGIPVLVSADLGERATETFTINGQQGTLVGLMAPNALPGLSEEWVLIDAAFAERVLTRQFEPTMALISANDSAAAAIASAVPESTTIVDSVAVLASSSARPSVSGLRLALAAASVLSAVMAGLGVVLAAVASAPARNRLMSVVHILGMSPRQLRQVVAWELAPVAITAIAAGVALGIALPFILLGVVDLGELIGGDAAVSVTIPWGLIALGVVGFGALVALAGAGTIAVARRADPARQVRIGAE